METAGECVVVLDGANVACQKDGKVQISKLAAAIEYFRSLKISADCYSVKCLAFAPNFWLNVKPTSNRSTPSESEAIEDNDRALLCNLVQKDYVILTPSQAHDDFYVIDYAVKHNGFIVTNDLFRDHVANKRTFRGRRLTSKWVRLHCIDFTFVGREFMPNPRAIERVLDFNSKTMELLPLATSSAHLSQSGVQTSLLNNEDNSNVADDKDGEDEMLIDHAAAKSSKNIDLSEVTYYRVPRELLPILHGEGGETMDKFQRYTGTYIVLPSYAVSSYSSITAQSNVLTLSIYGAEASRQQAVAHLDAFLVQMQFQSQNGLLQQQHYLTSLNQTQIHPRQQQFAASNETQDDNMMDVDLC
ncbi:Uncharacterized conserved protein [Plasmopara halstedii]|uniref:Uncharacterized conserved protein n=1 Tax=Plasmopara halstedii TaxID=4781 RepID=A0A0P1B1P4_PLAHL|nr:Uncharacterized conserved protein [Plasmopara halstedii]CEG47481.1 Uncharacterized conserved protein [Plasmopara halstedii]|eukprot:XP_024583850.1 Uncharacterized conserved protein [Plasmopara halstedii]